MGDEINWLVTVLYGDQLLKCALRVDKWELPEGRIDAIGRYPMEPENREAIHAMLPLHVRSCGPIVAVESLFAIHISKDSTLVANGKDESPT